MRRVRSAAGGEFLYHHRLILLPISINGQNAGLGLLDTGASTGALDERVAERLGVRAAHTSEVQGTAGTTHVRNAREVYVSRDQKHGHPAQSITARQIQELRR